MDFDGVIAEFSDDINDFGLIIDGAVRVIKKLKELGYKIIIHTARPSNSIHLEKLGNYLKGNNIVFDEINKNTDGKWKSDKPLADFYIDDRALRFNKCWDDILWQAMDANEMTPVEEYNALLSFVKKRADQVNKFDKFLLKETNWLTAPASTRFHLAEEGGLIKHSVNVAKTLIKMRRELLPGISLESCVIAALFHDVGKVGFPGTPYYIKNPNEWYIKNRGIKYTVNPECVHMDTSSRSLHLISSYVILTPEEAQAIRYHDGQYVDENRSVAHKEAPLTRLLQYADNWSGGVIESEDKNKK